MKITDYPSVQTLVDHNVFLVDGPEGTRQITAQDVTESLYEILGSDGYYEFLDTILPVEERRNTFRGKNLGSSFTYEQAKNIVNGTFKDLFLGDYWTNGNITWRIVDINYWLNTGDVNCTSPHLVIMPDTVLYNQRMNDSNITTGAYVGSEMYQTGLDQAKETIQAFFGENNILNHREYLQNATTNGYASAGAWYDSTVELPNEIMIYGSYIMTPAGNGSVIVNRYTIDKTQLALMKMYPRFININRPRQWLRDVVGPTRFAYVGRDGYASYYYAASAYGVRPVFGVTGAGLAG